MATLTIGDPVPWFTLPSSSNPNYHFDTVGGYRVVLFFFGSTQSEPLRQTVREFCALQSQFAKAGVPFFGVSIDPADQSLMEWIELPTYCKFLWDFDQSVSQRFGVCAPSDQGLEYTPTAFVLDETLRVLQVFPFDQANGYASRLLDYVSRLPQFGPPTAAARQAPILMIPRVLDAELCRSLIQLYESDGGRDSGFMREVDGRTVEVLDPGFKKRRDLNLVDTPLLDTVNQMVLRRIKPEIEKAFQFTITRFERHLVACYEATNQGFFNRHRDNTTKGTAHRRFAMSLNLNTGEYEGGSLRFPEYGNQLYTPEAGEAIIFSCSLLHEATPVTRGRRFALLSFFYNDEDARLRERNRKFLGALPDAADSADSADPSEAAHQAPNAKAQKTPAKAAKSGFQPKPAKKRR